MLFTVLMLCAVIALSGRSIYLSRKGKRCLGCPYAAKCRKMAGKK